MKKKQLIIIILLLIIDQGSKFYFESLLATSSIVVIPGFFELKMAYNTGAAWSILSGNVWPLIIMNFLILCLLIYLEPTLRESKLKTISFSLLYAGTLGNLIDRILFSHVKDFLSFTIFNYNFPIFNFADMFIVLGAIGLFIVIWKGESEYGSFYRHPKSGKIRQISKRKTR